MRTIQDYNEVKDLDYLQFINLRKQQGGTVDLPYFRTEDCNSKNPGSNDGRHRHHIYENLIPNLQDAEVAKVNDLLKAMGFTGTTKDKLVITYSESEEEWWLKN